MASTSNSTPVVVKDEPMDEASEGVAPVQNGSGPAMATDRAPPAPREPHPLDAVFDFLFNSDEFKDDNEALVENGGEAMANDGDGLKSLVRDNDRLLPLPPADAPTEAERFLEQYLKLFPPIRAGEYDPWAGYADLGLKNEPPVLRWEEPPTDASTSAEPSDMVEAEENDDGLEVVHDEVTLDDDVEVLGAHMTQLSIGEMKEKLATRAERLKHTGTTFEQGRILEQLCDEFAQFHVKVYNDDAEANPQQLAQRAYAEIVQPAEGELEDGDREGLLAELRTTITQTIEFRQNGWELSDAGASTAPTPYNPMNLSASKRPRQIVVDELARREVDQLRTQLDRERKEAFAKGIPMRKLTPREIRIFQGRHCTEGWEPSNGRFSRAVQMEKARLYFPWNRPKKQPEDEEDDNEQDENLDESALDTDAIDTEAEKDEEMEVDGPPSRRQSRPVERRKSRRQEITEEITRGMFLHRLSDESRQAIPVESLSDHNIMLPEEHERVETRRRQEREDKARQRRARSSERHERIQQLAQARKSRSAEQRRAKQPPRADSSPSPSPPPPPKRAAVASTSTRRARPISPAPLRRRTPSVLRDSQSSHVDLTHKRTPDEGGLALERDGSGPLGVEARTSRLRFHVTREGNVATLVKSIPADNRGYSTEECATETIRIPIANFTTPETERDHPRGIYIPSHDVRLDTVKGINPDQPFKNNEIREMEVTRNDLNRTYRHFTRTARAYEFQRIHKLIIGDRLLERLDDGFLRNAYHWRVHWPRMPHWVVEEMVKVEKAERKQKPPSLAARFPKQINTIFVAMGLDLLWGYHDKDMSGTWEKVRDFLEDFRDALTEILAYPVGDDEIAEPGEKVEFYKRMGTCGKDRNGVEKWKEMWKPVFHQGLKLVAITIPAWGHEHYINYFHDFNRRLRNYVRHDERVSLDDVPIELLDWDELVQADPDRKDSVQGRLSILMEAMRDRYAVVYTDPYG